MTAPAPAPEGLRITAATPNESGGFAANGGAQPGEKVVLRLNGSYIAEVVADALGRWSLTVERGLTAGFYALRAETFDASGKATGSTDATFAYAPRTTAAPEPASTPAIVAALEAKPEPLETKPAALETKPAEPAVAVAASPAEPVMTVAADPSHAVVAEIRTATVVKGDNLWDLARRFYGDGLRYADIFHANATQIHNPNLIYIGQVFVVPQARPTTP
jgi:nucleoid-associated protein YgaU